MATNTPAAVAPAAPAKAVKVATDEPEDEIVYSSLPDNTEIPWSDANVTRGIFCNGYHDWARNTRMIEEARKIAEQRIAAGKPIFEHNRPWSKHHVPRRDRKKHVIHALLNYEPVPEPKEIYTPPGELKVKKPRRKPAKPRKKRGAAAATTTATAETTAETIPSAETTAETTANVGTTATAGTTATSTDGANGAVLDAFPATSGAQAPSQQQPEHHHRCAKHASGKSGHGGGGKSPKIAKSVSKSPIGRSAPRPCITTNEQKRSRLLDEMKQASSYPAVPEGPLGVVNYSSSWPGAIPFAVSPYFALPGATASVPEPSPSEEPAQQEAASEPSAGLDMFDMGLSDALHGFLQDPQDQQSLEDPPDDAAADEYDDTSIVRANPHENNDEDAGVFDMLDFFGRHEGPTAMEFAPETTIPAPEDDAQFRVETLLPFPAPDPADAADGTVGDGIENELLEALENKTVSDGLGGDMDFGTFFDQSCWNQGEAMMP